MDAPEVDVFDRMILELSNDNPTKTTMLKARDIYNNYNHEHVKYCMCNLYARKQWARKFRNWYESRNR